MKVLKEWLVVAPWGKIAMISWGNPAGEPVLLVHGRQDSAATFLPMLELLPLKFHYVSFDFPGHGKSDPFPIGVKLMRFHYITAIDVVVKHLCWTRFIFLAHSLGSELGLFYNAIRPNTVKKFIHLDVTPGIQNNQLRPIKEFYDIFYGSYYENYSKNNSDDRVYTKRMALDAVMAARGMNQEQAEIILSRNLKCIGEDRYKLSWDRRTKNSAPLNLTNDFYYHLFTTNAPPSLFIHATNTRDTYAKRKEEAKRLMEDIASCKNVYSITVEGTHDVHFMHPERICSDIIKFMERDFDLRTNSKL